MLHGGWQQGYFGEETLVGRTRHDLMRVSLGAAVRANDDDGWAKVFDEVPAGAGDGKDIGVAADIAQYFESGVMLK